MLEKNKILTAVFVGVLALCLSNCIAPKNQSFAPGNPLFRVEGIALEHNQESIELIGPASSVTFAFDGPQCVVHLKNNNQLQNYLSVDLNGKYLGRFRLEGDSLLDISIVAQPGAEKQIVSLYKATEASNGSVLFCGVTCENLGDLPAQPTKSIQFIGNSITCGMGNDTQEIPCHTDQWYDQHNAYFAYGPVLSRMLNVRFHLVSVSGIGIYRNWDVDGPTMPQVFENQYLNANDQLKRDVSIFSPDIVSICLGTNDFSDGDGVHERLPFDAEKFTQNYIAFVETIIGKYPGAQIALLNSPMVSGEKDQLFRACLDQLVSHFETNRQIKIERFNFEEMVPNGCDYHPDIADHQIMADQLFPFMKQLLDK